MSATTTRSKKASKSHATKSTAPHAATVTATTATAVVSAPDTAAALPASAAATPASSESISTRATGALALVKQAMTMMAIVASPLSAAQVKASTKFRKGGETQIPALAEMSGTYGVEVPSRPTSAMESNLAYAEALVPLVALLVRFLSTLESASFQAKSEAWATATTLYAMLRKAAARQPTLKADLVPLEEFFSYRHPLVKETAPPTAVKLAKEAKRQQTAAKKLQRLQDAVAAAGGTVSSDATPPAAATSNAGVAAPAATPAAVTTPAHS